MKRITARKFHRYLSIIIGIQLLLWTTSGLIFSWNPIDQVRGEHTIRATQPFDLGSVELLGPQQILEQNSNLLRDSTITRMEIRSILDRPVYEISSQSWKSSTSRIFDARTGDLLSPIDPDWAREIAQQDFVEDVEMTSIEWVDRVVAHSEYRGKELPAYRVVLDHPTGTVIYVSADRGVVTTRRNNRWRLFDFFWMLHTMDYQGRDNFNHLVLRGMSIFGVMTVLSGFWLWWTTSRFRRGKNRQRV